MFSLVINVLHDETNEWNMCCLVVHIREDEMILKHITCVHDVDNETNDWNMYLGQ